MKVYVPKPDADFGGANIAPGSGIVGTPLPFNAGMVRIDYEGNTHGARNIVTFADRVLHAAERAGSGYPTVARAYVPADALVEVGDWDGRSVRVIATADLSAWLGYETLPGAELYPTGTISESEGRLSDGNR